jgi:hypothetical protein
MQFGKDSGAGFGRQRFSAQGLLSRLKPLSLIGRSEADEQVYERPQDVYERFSLVRTRSRTVGITHRGITRTRRRMDAGSMPSGIKA